MGHRTEYYKDGKIISVTDTRVFSKEQVKKKDEVDKELYDKLSTTDWQITRKLERPDLVCNSYESCVIMRDALRLIADKIKASIDAAKDFDVLDHIDTML